MLISIVFNKSSSTASIKTILTIGLRKNMRIQSDQFYKKILEVRPNTWTVQHNFINKKIISVQYLNVKTKWTYILDTFYWFVRSDDFDPNCTLRNNDRHVVELNTFEFFKTMTPNYSNNLSKWYANTKEQA